MWPKDSDDSTKFRAMGDLKAGIPSEKLASTFMEITYKCVKNNHKQRCNMDEV